MEFPLASIFPTVSLAPPLPFLSQRVFFDITHIVIKPCLDDDISQNEGFKNVSLGNVISAQPKQKMNFLDEEDEDLMFKYHKDSFEVQVTLLSHLSLHG